MDRITTPFDFSSTAAEVVDGIDLTGRRAVVTGGASGIGVETARALAATGAEVTIAVRDLQAGEQVATDIRASTGRPVDVRRLELTDLDSVDAFVAAWDGPLDILVNNAGIMATPETYTEQGWELQFATNHLGHFRLTLGLHDALAASGRARVVSVSSSAHFRSPVIFDDLFFRFMPYDPWAAYGQSKTANVLFAVEATRRWAAEGITANALMPGSIATNLQRHSGGGAPNPLAKTPEQGAATSVLLATSPLLEGVGGRYFVDNQEAVIVDRPTNDMTGVAPYALDAANAERLWDVSLELLGV
ncbi:oxidoreductase [Aeromicrobium sp. Root344]|uniref:SDR family NAD(P)-dependent oxidoreductase n=1 Tax=Aeromicrobium sp. Root344 TaxID=1736521 RepID=UPI0006F4BC74|nr:SDR family NAD(P)-dependent oxidoreductase [Aeromicrobium sp. Root344]KQV76981.1 oxidoreductase [Aeromicrobium sp. Root344]